MLNARKPFDRKAVSPSTNCAPRTSKFLGDLVVLASFRCSQNNLRTQDESRCGPPATRPFLQRPSLIVGQNDGFRRSQGSYPQCLEDQTPTRVRPFGVSPRRMDCRGTQWLVEPFS